MSALVTLTTDFGLQDHYVGVLHGVIAGIAPHARVVDLCHAVPPQDIAHGAYTLAAGARYFSADTIHVAVVDPGVGSERRAVAVHAGGWYWVAPDNGLLGLTFALLAEDGLALGEASGDTWHLAPAARAVVLAEPRWWLPAVSQTFHGRDIFAPVAAHLANGVDLGALGPATDRLALLAVSQPVRSGDGWRGAVLHADRFGNLITNLRGRHVPDARWHIHLAGQTIHGLSPSYAAMRGLGAIWGSDGHLEIVSPSASAAALLGCAAGTPVEAGPPPAGPEAAP